MKNKIKRFLEYLIFGRFIIFNKLTSGLEKELLLIFVIINITLCGLLIKEYKTKDWDVNLNNHQSFRRQDKIIDKQFNIDKVPRLYGMIIKYDLLNFNYFIKQKKLYNICLWNSKDIGGMIKKEHQNINRSTIINYNNSSCVNLINEILETNKNNKFYLLKNDKYFFTQCSSLHKIVFNTYQNTFNKKTALIVLINGEHYDQLILKIYIGLEKIKNEEFVIKEIKKNISHYNFTSFKNNSID